MRRGFNKYPQNEEDESRSENPSEQARSLTNLAFPFGGLASSASSLGGNGSLN